MMKKQLALCGLVALGLVLTGCEPKDHDHVHGEGGHDHDEHADDHSHEAPHGGTAIELGEHQYHLELVRDGEAGKLRAWVLDGHMENFVRIQADSIEVKALIGEEQAGVTLFAVADSATGETVGDTSYFEGQADWLKEHAKFDLLIEQLEVRGAAYSNLRFSFPEGEVAPPPEPAVGEGAPTGSTRK